MDPPLNQPTELLSDPRSEVPSLMQDVERITDRHKAEMIACLGLPKIRAIPLRSTASFFCDYVSLLNTTKLSRNTYDFGIGVAKQLPHKTKTLSFGVMEDMTKSEFCKLPTPEQ